MTDEKADQRNGYEEKCAVMDCCSPQKFAEMMAKCFEDRKCECFPMMKEGCCPPKEK